MNKDTLLGFLICCLLCVFIGMVIGSAVTKVADVITERQCVQVKANK